ncbi:MAG: alkaline phosphatase family protein [Bacteroidetes bacterium]|nr:alkaline phosphatase family protein [Bacteroidota bacterium]
MKKLLLIISFLCHICSIAQVSSKNKIISGPMLGQVELRTATVWIEVNATVKTVAVRYWKKDDINTAITETYKGPLGNKFNPVKIEIGGLDFNSTYQYQFIIDGAPANTTALFTTKDLWQWRKPAPDFSFLTGSCAYFNEPIFDRPGKPYGGDSTIFETMAKTPAAFMLWLGDNWYTREVDYLSEWGLYYRASHDRSLSVLKNFWKAMPHYAIWDDHDYGPDDSDGSYTLKDESRKLFKNYWCNPSFGQDDKGIFTKISYSDVDVFLTDDRYFRSSDNLLDSIDGKPNPDKHFFGKTQMKWLENALATSDASFKIIAIGSQVLNHLNKAAESMRYFSAEYYELMNFLNEQKINGVIFLTGDRHHSEVVKEDRANAYPLYDITSSPLTSGISKVRGPEINNPARVAGTLVEQQNFSKITVTGKKGERKLTVDFLGLKGEQLASWSVEEKVLKYQEAK